MDPRSLLGIGLALVSAVLLVVLAAQPHPSGGVLTIELPSTTTSTEPEDTTSTTRWQPPPIPSSTSTTTRGTPRSTSTTTTPPGSTTTSPPGTTTTTGSDPTTTTTTTTASTTTTVPATTTTTRPATGGTTAVAVGYAGVPLDEAPALETMAQRLSRWLGDRSQAPPTMRTGLRNHLDALPAQRLPLAGARASTARLDDGTRLAVVEIGNDVIGAVDEGSGWVVVGAHLPSLGSRPWFGDGTRMVLVLGSDARPGQDQTRMRADSIHIVTTNLGQRRGAVVGFPRDSWVATDYGRNDKLTHTMAGRGPDSVVAAIDQLASLPIDGWVVTGFEGFQALIDQFGGVRVDIPFAMADEKSKAYFEAGRQLLDGAGALAFSRNRHLSGGDFTRSFHQGVVTLAALSAVQDRGPLTLPRLVKLLERHTWTNLEPEELFTMALASYLINPDDVDNVVLPGRVGMAGAASVVFLESGARAVLDDLRPDGVLDQ